MKVTIDLDSTDVEVYGSKKKGVAYNYAGQRCGRPLGCGWCMLLFGGLTILYVLLSIVSVFAN